MGWDGLRMLWCEGGEGFVRLSLGTWKAEGVWFLLNVDHVVADGIGVRILAGRWLKLLAEEMGSAAVGNDEAKCLPPPWTEVMNRQQTTSGPEFVSAVRRQREFLITDCVCS